MHKFGTRERPHVLFDGSTPVALTNSVQHCQAPDVPDACVSGNPRSCNESNKGCHNQWPGYQVGNALPFWFPVAWRNAMVYQDRLGTNATDTQKQGISHRTGATRASRPCARQSHKFRPANETYVVLYAALRAQKKRFSPQ